MAIVVSSLVATAIWFLLPPAKPTVAARIHIPAKRPSLFGPNPLLDSESSFSPQTQAAFVKSRLVLNAALKDPKVVQANPSVLRDRDALSWLDQEIKVDFPDGPEILSVSMVGDQSDELIILVDAVVDAYIDESLADQSKSLRERIEKMDRVLRKQKERRTRLERQVEAISELNRKEEDQRNHIDGIEGLKKDLKLADASVTRIAAKLDELTSETGPTGQEAPARVRKLEDAAAFRPDEFQRKLRFAGIGAAGTFVVVLLFGAYLGFRSRLI